MRILTASAILAAVSMTATSLLAATPHREFTYYADAYADHYHVPRALVEAIIEQESGWNSSAVSWKGAAGLMQLMPETAQMYGVENRYSVTENLSGGVRYLADLLHEFRGETRLAVAAYYRGPGPLKRRGLSYGNSDVVVYVEAVRQRYERHLREEQLHRTCSSSGGQ